MRLRERFAALVLTEDARQVLEMSGLELPPSGSRIFQIEDHDDMGIWVREPREDEDHINLVRWDYILCVDVPEGGTKKVGMN